MAKSKRKTGQSDILIKGYLPVRVKLPTCTIGSEDQQDETFFFVKEHREGNSAVQSSDGGKNATLFIANAPILPGVKTKLLMKALLGKFGDIDRVTLVENPRKAASKQAPSLSWATNLKNKFPSSIPPIHSAEKFAHVVFPSREQMRRVLKSLTDIMSENEEGGEYPGLKIEKLELQVLQEETERLHSEELGRDDDDGMVEENKKHPKGILSVADRYRKSLASLSRDKLLDMCNDAMQEYEEAEESQRLAREAAANEPDDDGFITVTSKSVGVEGGKNELEKDKGVSGKRRRNANKRNRKKKESVGASELEDFYRFQRKETRKRTLQDLRKQFEEDLEKVKKMKENHEYKPFK